MEINMNKIVTSSLIKIANDLDNLGLFKFSNEVDSVIKKITKAENEIKQQQIIQTDKAINSIPETVEEKEKNIDNLEDEINNLTGPYLAALQLQKQQLEEDLKNGKISEEEYTTQYNNIMTNTTNNSNMPMTIV